MLKVSYKIKIGNNTITGVKQTNLLEIKSHASLSIPANSCTIVLGSPQNLTIVMEDSVSVELGYDDEQTLVFTGKVSDVEWGIDRVRIDGLSSIQNLTVARFNLLYEKPSAGDIVKDFLNKGKLKADKIEDGIKFSTYTLGDFMSAYDHLQRLAQQCGFDIYGNTEDKIVFAKYKAKNTHEFKYGEDILGFSLDSAKIGVEKVEIYGESPASGGQGEKASSWLTKKEVKGSAGSGTTLRLVDPTARTQAIAQKIAEGVLANMSEKQRGRMKVLGYPNVKLGDGVKVSKMPIKEQNGTFKVTGVSHRLNRRSGFFTVIDWEES